MRHGGNSDGRARRVEESGEPGRIDLAARHNLAAVDAGGDEEPVDAQTLRSGEIGAHGIANGKDARQARRAPAQLGGAREPIHVTKIGALEAATVVSSRSHRSPKLERALEALGVKAITSMGSAGLKGAEVARGAVEAHVALGALVFQLRMRLAEATGRQHRLDALGESG